MKTKIILLLIFILLIFSGCKKTNEVDEYKLGDIESFASGFKGADGITITPSGKMYVGNRDSNKIVYVDPNGKVEDFVTVTCQELLILTADANNNIYAAGTDKVFKITVDGEIFEIASDFGCADDLVFDQNGNLFVTDSKRNIIYKITPDLNKSIFIDNNYEGSIPNWFITGISFDKDYQNLYIVRMTRGEILKYPILEDGSAGPMTIIKSGLSEPDHMIVDDDNNLYVTLFRNGDLIKINNENEIIPISNKGMRYATGLVFGKGEYDNRFIYVADYYQDIIYRIYIG